MKKNQQKAFLDPVDIYSSLQILKKVVAKELCQLQQMAITSTGFTIYDNRTEGSPIRSVIILVITKSDDCAAGVRFVYHEYDYRLNWTTRSPIIN